MKVTLDGQELILRDLSDDEYDQASRRAKESGTPLSTCPTCGSKPELIDSGAGVRLRNNGSFKLYGETHECNCEAQIALRARYLLANIGYEYMILNWEDYDGDQAVREVVANYLEYWEEMRRYGRGLEFGGERQGTGKTFAATHIGKELIKYGQQVYFVPFLEMVAAYERSEAGSIADRMRTTTFLILDEILPPSSERQRDFYATQFEALMRYRVNNNLPTIITTNMNKSALEYNYERIYSLLQAKQIRVDVQGYDARPKVAKEEMTFAQLRERKPIT